MVWLTAKRFVERSVAGAFMGGLYYETAHPPWLNTVHLCAWITLLLLPFSFFAAFGRVMGACTYAALSFLFFFAVKTTNLILHRRLDAPLASTESNMMHVRAIWQMTNERKPDVRRQSMPPLDSHESECEASPRRHHAGSHTLPKMDHLEKSARRRSSLSIGVMGRRYVVPFDRRLLEAVLDRTFGWNEVVVVSMMASASAWLAIWTRPVFDDEIGSFFRHVVWFNLAGAHFTLLRRVRFDPCCYRLGIRWTLYSRAFYFILSCIIILIIDDGAKKSCNNADAQLFLGYKALSCLQLTTWKIILLEAHLALPLIFLAGWLPQISTLCTHLIEQVLIHVLGGSGVSDNSGAVLAVMHIGILIFPLAGFQRGALAISSLIGQQMADAFVLGGVTFAAHQCSQVVYSYGEFRRKCKIEVRSPTRWNFTMPTWQGPFINGSWTSSLLLSACAFILHSTRVLSFVGEVLVHVLVLLTVFVAFCNRFLVDQMSRPFPFGIFSCALIDQLRRRTCTLILKRVEFLITWLLFSAVTELSLLEIRTKRDWDIVFSSFAVVVSAFKAMHMTFRQQPNLHLHIFWLELAWILDLTYNPTMWFVFEFSVASVLVSKLGELFNKLRFIIVYVGPWNKSCSSLPQVIISLLALPHTALIAVQILLAAVISAPVFPILGSTAFTVSYPRPLKYWEKNYTKRGRAEAAMVHKEDDAAHRDWSAMNEAGYDINNLNAILYEQIADRLSQTLQSRLFAGEWGHVVAGDFFIMTNEDFVGLVHIVSIGAGYVEFQFRGVEVRGTLCHQQEQAALISDWHSRVAAMKPAASEESEPPRHFRFSALPALLRISTLSSWTIRNEYFLLPGYSFHRTKLQSLFLGIDDVSQVLALLQFSVVHCVVQSISFANIGEIAREFAPTYRIRAHDLLKSTSSSSLLDRLDENGSVSLDPIFLKVGSLGSVDSIVERYSSWLHFCFVDSQASTPQDSPLNEVMFSVDYQADCCAIVALVCELLQEHLLVERPSGETEETKPLRSQGGLHSSEGLIRDEVDICLSTMSERRIDVEKFVLRLARLFQGDFRDFGLQPLVSANLFPPSHDRNECAVNSSYSTILTSAVQPGVQAALRIHYASYQDSDIFSTYGGIHEALVSDEKILVCPEFDSRWKESIMKQVHNSLLSIRYEADPFTFQLEDERPEIMLIYLQRDDVPFKVVHLNPECVRGLWSAQQHELLFCGNWNAERGSIQEMSAVFRNLIGQSCDIPVGYPNYVSPLIISSVDLVGDVLMK